LAREAAPWEFFPGYKGHIWNPYQTWSQAHHAIGASNHAEIVFDNKVADQPDKSCGYVWL
jgi:hypothetical protein